MARTRQKAKQRKAKRLEQERKAAERSGGRVEHADTRRGSTAEALAEIEEAQVRAAQELEEAQEVEVGAGAEAARTAAAAEAATAAEVATTGEPFEPTPVDDGAAVEEVAPAKPSRRERRRAREEAAQKEKPKPAKERKREPKPPAKAERKAEPRSRNRVVNFLRQVWAELRRVQWPNRTQVTQATAVVIVFCFIAGSYLAIWDWFFSKLIKAII